MKKHTKIYMEYFGYTIADFIPCESCGSQAVDIHHIKARGMGGSKTADHIENLMALCRICHDTMGDIKSQREYLEQKHKQKMNQPKKKPTMSNFQLNFNSAKKVISVTLEDEEQGIFDLAYLFKKLLDDAGIPNKLEEKDVTPVEALQVANEKLD